MYQALYRKYRPTTFEDVVGQEVIVKTLKNAIINNKLSHAYIFSGPRGTGKTSIAKILAKAVNCLNEDEIICNKCVSCTQINSKQSTDIIEIDAASNNGIDEIREIRNKVNLVPSSGKYKIYIIDEVHMLTTGAFNALLKTLEEPPKHAIFILATTEDYKIPSTIVSRCQKFDFKKIKNNKMAKRIKQIAELEKINIDNQCIDEIVRLSDGGLRDCISLLDQVNAYSNGNITYNNICEINGIIGYKTLLNFIKGIFNKDTKYLLKKINTFNDNGKNFVKISEELLLYLRNILLFNIDEELINNKECYYDFRNVKIEDIINLIELINNDIDNIKKSTDPQLIFEILILKSNHLEINYNFEFKGNDENISTNNKNENMLNDDIEKKVTFDEKENNDKFLKDINKELNKENMLNDDIEKKVTFDEKENNDKDDINDKIVTFSETNDKNIEKIEDYSIDELINKLQEIRVNNTLSKFNKKILNIYKTKMEEFKKYSSSKKYSFASDLIYDGILKAISNEYIIIMYNTNLTAETFNRNLCSIEELINIVFERQFKAIAVDQEKWNNIKEVFNNKSKVFEYKNESSEIYDLLLKKINNEEKKLDDLYGSLVKYEEE